MNIDTDIEEKRENLFKKFESLYIEGEYKDIIELKSKYPVLNNLDILQDEYSPDEYSQLIEIFAGSFTQLDMFSEAIELIDCHINLLKGKHLDEEVMDDLTTFFHFKIIIKQKRKALFSEYKTINEYIALGGTDSNLLDIKKDVENLIYERYIIANKVIYGIAIIVTVLIIFFPKIFRNTYTSVGTTVVVVWMVINYIFYKKIEVLFMKALNFISKF